MAKLYGEIAAKALLTLDKSFARANGQPLDASEVYYSLEAAKTYAATAQAYIGQKIVVVEDGVVTHYSVEDTAGNLKELGSKPVGDEKTITVAENGTISLKGIDSLVFERDIVDAETGEPTGEKEAVQYQPLMTAAGLIWVEPSKTTVEGLATLIEALTGRVNALEGKVGAAAAGETAATGLFALINAETTRAEAAEKALQDALEALDEAVKAIDYVDEDELAEAIKDFATTTYVNEELAKKVNTADYNVDKKAFEDEDAAIRAIAEEAQQLINDFLTGTDTDEVVNKLKEIQAELDKLGGVVDLEAALALKADLEYVNTELAKKQNVIAEGTYATPDDVATAKGEAIADAEGKIAAAETRAATDAQSKADAAKQAAIADADGKLANKADKANTLAGYGITDAYTATETDAAIAAKIKEMTGGESAADVLSALNDYKKVNDREIYGDTFVRDHTGEDGVYDPGTYSATSRIDALEAVGAQANVIEGVQVNGADLIVDSSKKVNIDLSGYGAKTAVEKAQADATQALADAAAAQNKANANEGLIGGLDSRVGAVETKTNDNATAIANHATEFATLKGRVDGHDTAIEQRALKTQVYTKDEVNAITGTPTEGKTLVGMINDKANSDSVYTKEQLYTKVEIDAKMGIIPEGSNLIAEIEKATGALANGAIKDNTTAIKAIYDASGETPSGILADEIARAVQADQDNADAIAELKDTIGNLTNVMNFRGVVENTEAGFAEDIKVITDPKDGDVILYKEQEYVYSNGLWVLFGDAGADAATITALTQRVADAESAINTINTTTIPNALATALADYKVKNVDNVTLQVSEAGVASVKAISTDLLVQGNLELVLNGGKANA